MIDYAVELVAIELHKQSQHLELGRRQILWTQLATEQRLGWRDAARRVASEQASIRN